MYKCIYVKLLRTLTLGNKGQRSASKSCWLREMRQDAQTNRCQLPNGTERHAQNQNLVSKRKNTADTSRARLQASLFSRASAEIPSYEVLHCYSIATLFPTKWSAGSLYTLDIYALITDNQIQFGQSVNRNSYTLKPPAVVNSSPKAFLL